MIMWLEHVPPPRGFVRVGIEDTRECGKTMVLVSSDSVDIPGVGKHPITVSLRWRMEDFIVLAREVIVAEAVKAFELEGLSRAALRNGKRLVRL